MWIDCSTADEFYGMTYIPSSGKRDSWSAYRISDEQLDDNDDLVYESAKRDHDCMKRVNNEIVSTRVYSYSNWQFAFDQSLFYLLR